MKILAMDTSTWALAVGVTDNGRLLGEFNTYVQKNHSLRLMPAIEQLLAGLDLKPSDLDLVAVAHGPGSYTGVRIGVTTAKTLAWSLKRPILGLSSLQTIAQNRTDFKGFIVPIFDARREHVYGGIYKPEGHLAKPVAKDRIQPLQQFLEEVQQAGEGPFLFIGEGVPVHRHAIAKVLGDRAHYAPESDSYSRGRSLVELAWHYRAEAQRNIHAFAPQYLQLAEAEKKWLEKQNL
ncbi:universal protein YeaZ [Caldalkalibacillus thermarum TA2.A1]|uniref:Universal protein YeaZ n=1 Tax=Caldalkalibacillus thermarum (strain TA2.A1) TaxID=986075 RepID=F5L6N1_CALTT|nr:tRNA (adenosine(37)-N6)-threonylcarbamoyltransferase complex dimerization subunit type 1 TsaB [Caldalkalibacillus thermarum]EGL82982.1 universal protein YeaZ [Caldalkalibacillus thermarum TA2.A1]QZT34580.1 tRNA (adenosine(37)-N6)-threonylcarbamoyltransferase complex dimerization subunit type 1 TsaB [Caldalkalibacillus thermarum TA2.A1]